MRLQGFFISNLLSGHSESSERISIKKFEKDNTYKNWTSFWAPIIQVIFESMYSSCLWPRLRSLMWRMWGQDMKYGWAFYLWFQVSLAGKFKQIVSLTNVRVSRWNEQSKKQRNKYTLVWLKNISKLSKHKFKSWMI